MMNPDLLSGDIDIHQQRSPFEDPSDVKVLAVTNILIYCSFYYPHTKQLANIVTIRLSKSHPQILNQAITHLRLALQKQIITGPSSSFLPPGQVPHLHRSNTNMIIPNKQASKSLGLAITDMCLNDIFSGHRIKELGWYNCSKLLSMKSTQQYQDNYRLFQSQLQVDGESWLQTTPFPTLFCLLQTVLEAVLSQTKFSNQIEQSLRLTWARIGFMHNRILQNPVKKLSEIVLKNYREVIQLSLKHTTLEDYTQLLLQYSFSLLFYYKYNQAQSCLRHCCSLLQIKIQFTGKLGRRTKYQSFDTPQLVMNLQLNVSGPKEQDTSQFNQQGDGDTQKPITLTPAKELVAKQRGIALNQGDKIKQSTYDQESILLQTPKFVEQQGQNNNVLKSVNQQQLLVTLAISYYQWRSTPHDQMLYQNIAATIMTLLKYEQTVSFSYNFSLLLLRSLNQFPRIKHMERALDQLQRLKALYNGRNGKQIGNIYATPYETHLGFVVLLAEKYMELGLSIAAVELFEQAGLYEECIDALIKKNFKERALELVQKLLLEKGKNARLLCMLGDIKANDPQYYEEAWQLSKNTSARSQRSLGWFYFGKGNYQKAIQSFTKATQASYYHPNTWFTLGCTYMRLNQFEKALKAFSECISIDDTQGQAWGNMASCYMYLKKTKEAYSTLEQAVRYSESNWKLWANLLSVALSLKKFYKYFECIDRLVKLGHQQVLTDQVIRKVVQVMGFKNQSNDRKRIVFNFRNRINMLFQNLQHNIGQNPLVWRNRSLFEEQILEYIKKMAQHYRNLHITDKLDINDLVPGYETLISTESTTLSDYVNTKDKIVEYKQNELNMTMRIGWHQSKIECEKVKQDLLEYIQIYKNYSSNKDKEDFRLFVAGVSQKIAYCLEQPFAVNLQWL